MSVILSIRENGLIYRTVVGFANTWKAGQDILAGNWRFRKRNEWLEAENEYLKNSML